jgi:pimeloyl-ACP methyl ester carboxylesterase
LVFDYRAFGDSEGSPRQVISFRTQLEDWAAAIRFARTLPGVDGSKVVTWGFSLGAGHAVTSATRDGRVAAVVSIAPMLSGLSATLAAMRWWSLLTILRLMGRGVLDVIASIFRRNPVLVPISAPAGDLGLLTSPDAYPGYEAIVPSDFEFGTAARIALYFWTYAPGRLLRRLRVPVLLMPSTLDKICPPRPTLRRARSCPHVEVVELECEHMEVAVEPNRTLVIDATLEFLQKHMS